MHCTFQQKCTFSVAPSSSRTQPASTYTPPAFKAGTACGRTSSRGLARRALLCQASKTLSGACIVKLTSQNTVSCTVQTNPAASLQEYMANAAENFANIELPLGGKITKVDATHVELVVPRIQIFDVWLQPRAIAALSVFPERIGFSSTTEGIALDGSHHVKEFRLDERFNLDVQISIVWNNEAGSDKNTSGTDTDSDGSSSSSSSGRSTIDASGQLLIEVDIPPPFSFMPKPLLTTTGNAAMAATNSIILNAFVSSLARDYTMWAQDPQVRKKRQQATLST